MSPWLGPGAASGARHTTSRAAALHELYPQLVEGWDVDEAPWLGMVQFAHDPWKRRDLWSSWPFNSSTVMVSTAYNGQLADGSSTKKVRHQRVPYRHSVGAFSVRDYERLAVSEHQLLFELGVFEAVNTVTMLELGCGTLRLGRLAMNLLLPTRYHCIEPNKESLSKVIHYELGWDVLLRKRPQIVHNTAFRAPANASTYRVILAQSIFTHTAADMLASALDQLMPTLIPGGILIASLFTDEDRSSRIGANAFSVSGWMWHGTQASFAWFPLQRLRQQTRSLGYKTAVVPFSHQHQQSWIAFCNVMSCPDSRSPLKVNGTELTFE